MVDNYLITYIIQETMILILVVTFWISKYSNWLAQIQNIPKDIKWFRVLNFKKILKIITLWDLL